MVQLLRLLLHQLDLPLDRRRAVGIVYELGRGESVVRVRVRVRVRVGVRV